MRKDPYKRHCVTQEEYEKFMKPPSERGYRIYPPSICGLRSVHKFSPPSLFLKKGPEEEYCKNCIRIKELPMILLGALE